MFDLDFYNTNFLVKLVTIYINVVDANNITKFIWFEYIDYIYIIKLDNNTIK